jgi:hypothetical protein
MAGAPAIHAKALELIHSDRGLGAFLIRVENQQVAIGQSRPMVGYVVDGQLRWCDLAEATDKKASVRGGGNAIEALFEATDADSCRWRFRQRFSPRAPFSAIDVQTDVSVDKERAVAFLPMLMLFPGAGSFGAIKGQALLAGCEYLDDEPSSSEADVIGPAARRQVPDNLKLTFPLMALEQGGVYLALTWQMRPQFSAVFDSPDRLFGSGGHAMGLLFPSSDGKNREEGNLLPRSCPLLRAGQVLSLRATLFGGSGKSIVPAVEQYVALRGLPPAPASSPDLHQYVALAAGGWLDSKIREGNLIRHAVAGGNFNPGPAADAGLWMDWLAGHSRDVDLVARLKTTAQQVLQAVPPEGLNFAAVGHIRSPVESLVYGHVAENAARAEQTARALLARFEPDGAVLYRPVEGGTDYSKTHTSHEANGFTSRVVLDLLENAVFCGNRELLETAVKRLHAMDKFNGGVPRGAQTWECPLHTPDILASAQMVRAYTLGYELTGEQQFLDQARYWAWTGVPFVYLVSPTDKPVGPYATIAVFGATLWQAPVWLGLPVQWCGLVYADALYRLVRDDPKGPWKTLADGITLSGIEQTWPQTDTEKQGLLPDSFVLRDQKRNGPAINPATLQACASRFYDPIPIYDFHVFPENRLVLHAPGRIGNMSEKLKRVTFQIESWADHAYFILIDGLAQKPRVEINDVAASPDCLEFFGQQGLLILKLEGNPRVGLSL